MTRIITISIMQPVKHLPGWLPGTGFKKTAAAWRNTLLNTIEKPYRFVEEQMSRGTYAPSYVASLLEEDTSQWTAEEEHAAKWTAASLYLGGADTVCPIDHINSLHCPTKITPHACTHRQLEKHGTNDDDAT